MLIYVGGGGGGEGGGGESLEIDQEYWVVQPFDYVQPIIVPHRYQ